MCTWQAWAEHKGLCSPVSPALLAGFAGEEPAVLKPWCQDSRRSTMSSRAGKWSPVQAGDRRMHGRPASF